MTHALLLLVVALAGDVPEKLRPVREHVVKGIADGLAPSLALAVIEDGRVVWAEGFGHADLERKTPATADTIYWLASVSKPITATGLMILVEEGRLELDAPANRYLPGAKLVAHRGEADAITLRRLANHTAGLPTHYNFFHDDTAPPPLDETLRRYGFAATAPGARWEYSNLGFGILGFLTGQAAGEPWGRFLEKRLFDPLGMTRTSDRVRPGLEADAAVPYAPDVAARPVRVTPYRFDHPAASTIWSTANDLARFVRMHLGDGALDDVRVLRAESAAAMRAPATPGLATGIGWGLGKRRGRGIIGHTGGMPGVATIVRAWPAERAGLVVLANTSMRKLGDETAKRIEEALFPDAPEEPSGGEERAPAPDAGPRKLEGAWLGRLAHFRGDVALRLDVTAKGEARLGLGDRPPVALREARIQDDRLTGRLEGLLEIRPDFHGNVTLELRLALDGGRLSGVALAQASGYFALPHWVDLARPAK
jgi:CubicO group peptidase (beta-lactamase class C family)